MHVLVSLCVMDDIDLSDVLIDYDLLVHNVSECSALITYSISGNLTFPVNVNQDLQLRYLFEHFSYNNGS